MAFSDIKSSRKAKVVAAAVVAVVAIVVIALSAVSCSNESAADAIGADKAIARAIESANDNIEGANHEEAAPEDAGALNEGAEGVRSGDDEASAAEAQHAEESAKPENRKTAKPTEDAGTTSPSSPQPTPEPAEMGRGHGAHLGGGSRSMDRAGSRVRHKGSIDLQCLRSRYHWQCVIPW